MTKLDEGWNRLVDFHKSFMGNNSMADKGIKALQEISDFAKNLKLKIPEHPFLNVRFITNIHYNWLFRMNKLIKILSQIPNYEPRIKRFFNEDDYFVSLRALYEIEMALKFKLQDFDVIFTDENTKDKTPDIEVKFDNNVFNLEVTTINNPDDDKEKNEFHSKLRMLMLKHKIGIGGVIIDVPKQTHEQLIQEIESKIIDVKSKNEEHTMIKEGSYNLTLSPVGGSSRFVFVHKELKDIEDKVIQTIKDKGDQLSVNNNPSILCIYCGSRSVNLEQLYTKGYDKIGYYIQTMPNLSGLVLSLYSDFFAPETLKHLESSNGQRVFKELTPGFGEREQSIIWRNDFATIRLPPEFLRVYDNFENNIENL